MSDKVDSAGAEGLTHRSLTRVQTKVPIKDVEKEDPLLARGKTYFKSRSEK